MITWEILVLQLETNYTNKSCIVYLLQCRNEAMVPNQSHMLSKLVYTYGVEKCTYETRGQSRR